VRADADKPGWRTREKRRAKDLAFLEWLKIATMPELTSALRGTLPEWRRVAIQRRLDSTPEEP
jgi:hypothetical protein